MLLEKYGPLESGTWSKLTLHSRTCPDKRNKTSPNIWVVRLTNAKQKKIKHSMADK
jgi:hypothetical protein